MIQGNSEARSAGEQPPRLRVLQVGKFYPPHMGGIETHMQNLCHELNEVVDVSAVVANGDRRLVEEEVDGIPVARLGTAIRLSAAPLCPDMVRRLRETTADIVHIHLPNPGAVLAFLASGYTGRLVVSYHSDVVRQWLLEPLFRPFLMRFLRRADAIVVATPNHIDSSPILRNFRSRCVVIPYGVIVDEAVRPREEEVQRIRSRFGPRIVLGVGRLVYYKGFEYLVRAMKDIDAHLLLVGDGPMRDELESEVTANGVREKVTFLGRIGDISPYYGAADVFVLPSVARTEAFGIVQLEAMACGTPVVNTSLDSGVPHVSLHNVSGLTVPPGDTAALRDAVNRILGDDTLRASLGAAARRRVEQEFSREVMGRRTLELYTSLLGKGEITASRTPRKAAVRSRPNQRLRVS